MTFKLFYDVVYMLRRFFAHIPDHEKRITISTMVTLVRVILVPFIVAAMVMHAWGIAWALFSVAALTDMLDGNLARWLGEKTFLGACLDPIADKLLVLSCFFTLAFVQSPLFTIPSWFFWLVLIKEVVQIIGFIAIYLRKGHMDIQPRLLGKLSAVMQMGFICWVFACYFFGWVPLRTYYVMLVLVLGMVGASFLQYGMIGLRWMYR